MMMGGTWLVCRLAGWVPILLLLVCCAPGDLRHSARTTFRFIFDPIELGRIAREREFVLGGSFGHFVAQRTKTFRISPGRNRHSHASKLFSPLVCETIFFSSWDPGINDSPEYHIQYWSAPIDPRVFPFPISPSSRRP
ncbi:hypothetical protein ASPACDRAFT_81045 [Aspergillus aculeatus ATCC 16872]|uniref:Secreted protein n=1 Tax=Aspergillus aculeatus (strain ATCC 16872 / CBS 172.66 / WB 5094) TaxID=690307 RepID=A0A1L9WKZ9_ASPA1|nr:uncharacterized protein ASPACDRAFT_81045 [Aspergillus aculeatus ATCC 16872]OJJ96837.1 hypothetical protein ASPACDRAFT_81045 [Aspergillus aculeatus ATCC 16872]